jgi:hypothetical protein
LAHGFALGANCWTPTGRQQHAKTSSAFLLRNAIEVVDTTVDFLKVFSTESSLGGCWHPQTLPSGRNFPPPSSESIKIFDDSQEGPASLAGRMLFDSYGEKTYNGPLWV